MTAPLGRDLDLIRLAREIAIDHYDIEDILNRYQLTYEQWSALCGHPRFTQLLANEEEAWLAATNTTQRVKLKSAAVIEQYLEKAHASLMNDNEALVAKTGLAKLIASFAGIGGDDYQKRIGQEAGGFSITINLGDRTLNIDRSGAVEAVVEDEDDVLEIEGLPALEVGEDVFAINADLA